MGIGHEKPNAHSVVIVQVAGLVFPVFKLLHKQLFPGRIPGGDLCVGNSDDRLVAAVS
jgi:hypothetical protein